MTDAEDTLKRIEALLSQQNALLQAILATVVDGQLKRTQDRPASRFGGIDHLLSEGGLLRNSDVARVLGKSPQAVGQAISRQKDRREVSGE